MQLLSFMHPLRLTLLIAGLLMIPALSGCLGGSSPAVRFYVLSPMSDSIPADGNNKLAVEISTIHLPQYLDRPHLVTRSGNNRLKILQDDLH